METVRIYRLDHLPRVLAARLRDAQMEAARVWTLCRDLHQAARHHQLPWPTRDDLQKATKGRFALLVNALRSERILPSERAVCPQS